SATSASYVNGGGNITNNINVLPPATGATVTFRPADTAPRVSKSFSPATAPPGSPVTLTFTITSPNPANVYNNLAFTDTLPSGLIIANPPNASMSICTGGSVSAPANGTVISVSTFTLPAGQASCTVSVNVTSTTPGTYVNNASNFSSTGFSPLNP